MIAASMRSDWMYRCEEPRCGAHELIGNLETAQRIGLSHTRRTGHTVRVVRVDYTEVNRFEVTATPAREPFLPFGGSSGL